MIMELTNVTEKFTYNSGILQYLLLTNVQVMQAKIKQRNVKLD